MACSQGSLLNDVKSVPTTSKVSQLTHHTCTAALPAIFEVLLFLLTKLTASHVAFDSHLLQCVTVHPATIARLIKQVKKQVSAIT